MLVIVYVEKLITKHAENKKSDFTLGLGGSNKITIAGTKQLSDDLKAILKWMAITCQSFQGSSVAACSALGNDVPIVNAEMSEDSV